MLTSTCHGWETRRSHCLSDPSCSDTVSVIRLLLLIVIPVLVCKYCFKGQPYIAVKLQSSSYNVLTVSAFLPSKVGGLFGNIFCACRPEITVLDMDREDPPTGIVASINNDNPTLVFSVDDKRLQFQHGDLVIFSEILGMTELNVGKPRKVKPPKVIKFKPLQEAMVEPEESLLSDFSKFEQTPFFLHAADAAKAVAAATDTEKFATLKAQRRARGEYFKCGGKFIPGHKYPPNISFSVLEELCDALQLDTSEPEHPSCDNEDSASEASEHEQALCLSAAASSGIQIKKTLRLQGYIVISRFLSCAGVFKIINSLLQFGC